MKELNVSEEYKIASTEVLSILKYLPKNEVDKIPYKFKKFLKENSISDYQPTFDYSQGLDKIELKHKTKLLLGMIYKNYICSDEEQLEYNKILVQNEKIYQEHLKEKYHPDDIFKKVEKDENTNTERTKISDNSALVEYKESFFTMFKNFIFKILHRNN